MESKKIKNRSEFIIFILAILGLLVVVNYFGIRVFKRFDMTEGREYSISPATKKILKKLDDIITIKVFFSKNLPPHLKKTVMDVKDILSEYSVYAGKNLQISWEDPAENEETGNLARSLGIPELQLQTYEKDKIQAIKAYMGIGILYADKKEAIPFVQNLRNLEYDLTMAIMKVSRSSVPKVAILKTDTFPEIPPHYRAQMQMPKNPESTEEKLSVFYKQLGAHYDASIVDLSNGNPIDSSIKTLVIPGGQNMTQRKIFEIDQFFMNGGNLIVLADAVSVNLQYGPYATPTESKLLDLLEFYGVRVEKNLVLDHSCSQVSIPQQVGPFTMNVAVPYPYFVRLGANSFKKDVTAVSNLTDVVFPWVSSLTLLVDQQKNDSAAVSTQENVNATVLAQSSEKSWPITGNFDLNPQQQWTPPSDNLRQHNLAAYLNGNFKSYFAGKSIPPVNETDDTLSQINLKQPADDAGRNIVTSGTNGHLVVIGDADFVSGQNAGQPGNVTMLINLVDWLSLDDNLISIRSRSMKDRTIESDLLKQGSNVPNFIRLINVIGMPLLVAVGGLIIFIRRREHIPVTVATNTKPENASK